MFFSEFFSWWEIILIRVKVMYVNKISFIFMVRWLFSCWMKDIRDVMRLWF